MFIAWLSAGIIAMGLFCLWTRESHLPIFRRLLRNDRLGKIVFGLASILFLIKILQLGEADFGRYKFLLVLIFGFALLGCALYWQDFLIVRGMVVLGLIGIQAALDINFATPDLVRPWISAYFYLWIFLMIYAGVCPYCVRDILPYLYQSKASKMKYLGITHLMYGGLLITLMLCCHE